MSVGKQKAFLKKLHEELSGTGENSSEAYRELTANKYSHNFVMTRRALLAACVDAYIRFAKDMNNVIIKRDGKEWKETKKWAKDKLTEAANTCISETKNNFFGETAKRKPNGVEFNLTARKISTDFEVELKVIEKYKTDIFNMIKVRYDEPLTKFFMIFEDEAKERLQVGTLTYKTLDAKKNQIKEQNATKGFVFQLEHMSIGKVQSSSIDLFIAEKFEKARKNKFSTKNAAAFATYLGLKKVIDPKKPTVVQVFLGSGEANRAASTAEGQRRRLLLNKILEDLEKLSQKNAIPLADLPGSDSAIQTEQKKVLIALDIEFSKIKNKRVKVKFKEDKKLDKSQQKPTLLHNKPKIQNVSGKYRVNKSKASSRRVAPKSNISNLNIIIGLINKDLPKVVAKNMQSPALNYRTGRFASSVRVTDVVTTPKGFPSIGYTYDKSRYQTFEPGFAQGSVDRDPRKLIDKSMREIAAQYAIGRFFTRRV